MPNQKVCENQVDYFAFLEGRKKGSFLRFMENENGKLVFGFTENENGTKICIATDSYAKPKKNLKKSIDYFACSVMEKISMIIFDKG